MKALSRVVAPESHRLRTDARDSGAFPEATEFLQAAPPNPRGSGTGLLRGHPGGAGGVGVLLSEAVMHGTASWRADHERRTLLYARARSSVPRWRLVHRVSHRVLVTPSLWKPRAQTRSAFEVECRRRRPRARRS